MDTGNLTTELTTKAKADGISLMISRVVVVRYEEGQPWVLLLKRASHSSLPNREEPPGGKVEEGEDLVAAALRELKEETGIEATSPLSYLCHLDFPIPTSGLVREFHFYTETDQSDITYDKNEHSSFRWVPLSQLKQTEMHEDICALLDDNLSLGI